MGILILGWRQWRKSRGEMDWVTPYAPPLRVPMVENGERGEESLNPFGSGKDPRLEARKHPRLKGRETSMAAISRSADASPWLSGQVIDISRGGLALACLSGEEKGEQDVPFCLRIYDLQPPFVHIEDVPGRIVYDLESKGAPEGSGKIRRCGVEFGELAETQLSRLEYFLENCTVGKV